MLTAAGWHGDYPPADEQGLNAFVESLPLPDIYRIVGIAKPLSDIHTYRFMASQRYHYEAISKFPDGLLVLGDAVASFNPVYGQGMSSAAMQAQALDSCFKSGYKGRVLRREYFRKVARIVDVPWQLATGEDFRFPETEGTKPIGTNLLNAYVTKVHKATHTDTFAYRQFLKVMNLMQSPKSLLRPDIVWRVMWSNILKKHPN